MVSKVIFMIMLILNFIGCVRACPDGFHGDNCNKKCPENCIACRHEKGCTKCKLHYNGWIDESSGTHTHICEGQCAENCVACSKHYLNCTACVDGYYIGHENDDPGRKRTTYCIHKCFSNCKTCGSYKNCSECNDGYFGQQCDKKCPANCTKCDKRSGRCLGKCKTGHFGPYCNLTCSRCKNNNCSFNGKCLKGCKDGFYGSFCEKMCPQNCQRNCNEEGKCYSCKNGYFGESCNKTCSKNCLDLSCNQNGTCYECIKSYCGSSCKTPCPSPCLVGVCDKTTGICLQTEQDMMSNVHEQGGEKESAEQICDPGKALGMIPCELRNDRNTYYNTGTIVRKTSLIDLPKYIQNKAEILNDFQLLPVDLIKPYADSQRADNVHRNRYRTVYPYDFNRVKLNNVENDYINASYIDGYNRQKAYIAALGPTAKTTSDFELFWHMVWQENVEKIVMLTNLVEAGGPKCDMYWPRNGCTEIYGDMKVACLQEDVFADYTLRVIELSEESSKRALHHFHYTGWPDKGVPSELSSIIDLRQKVLHAPSVLRGPVLIHCSAGVGRTGTYIALDILIEQGEQENGVEIYSCVRNLREQRVNMVQTLEQYQFLHNTVAYALFVGCKPIPEGQFEVFMDGSSKEDIGDIYEKMQKVNELKSKMEKEVVARNKMLMQQNREGADIPDGLK